ncbi:hypothetical protein ACWC09_32005 [Streptomyces sp. NPDC001617]
MVAPAEDVHHVVAGSVPLSMGGSGSASANVKKTATMTAAAAKTTRPEWVSAPTPFEHP